MQKKLDTALAICYMRYRTDFESANNENRSKEKHDVLCPYSVREQLSAKKLPPLQYDELSPRLRGQMASTLINFVGKVDADIPRSRAAAVNRNLPRFTTTFGRYKAKNEEEEIYSNLCEMDLWETVWSMFSMEMGVCNHEVEMSIQEFLKKRWPSPAGIRKKQMQKYFEQASTTNALDGVDVIFQCMLMVFITVAEDRRCDVKKLLPHYTSTARTLNGYFLRASVGYQMLPEKVDKRFSDQRFRGLVMTKIDSKYPRRNYLYNSSYFIKTLHADILEFVQAKEEDYL